MAFGFNGFRVGQQIGQAAGKPLDLSPTTDFLIKNQLRHQDIHQKMLEAVSKNLQSFNPKGVMQQDMPVVLDKYNKWRELEMEHPEATYNPKSPYFSQINAAHQELLAKTNELVDGAKQIAAVSKAVTRSQLKGRKLSAVGLQRWNDLMNHGYSGYLERHPGEFNLEQAIIPTIQDSNAESQLNINKNLSFGTRTDQQVQQGDVATTFSRPPTSYLSMLSESANRYAHGLTDESKGLIDEEYRKSVEDGTLDNMVQSTKDLYNDLPDGVITPKTKKLIDDLDVKDPQSYFVLKALQQNIPIGKTSTESAAHRTQRYEETSDRNYNLALQRLGHSIQVHNDVQSSKWSSAQRQQAAKIISDAMSLTRMQHPSSAGVSDAVLNDSFKKNYDAVVANYKKNGVYLLPAGYNPNPPSMKAKGKTATPTVSKPINSLNP